MGLFTKFRLPFEFSKQGLSLPAPEIKQSAIGTVGSYKTLASFELNMTTPRYIGDVPKASVKFYPLDYKW